MTPMRINIILGPFLSAPPQPAGAVEMRWTRVAEEIATAGHTTTLLTRRAADQPASQTLRGVEHRRSGSWKRTNRWLLDIAKDFAYSVGCLRRLPDADITVTNTFWLPVLLPLFGRRAGKVVVNVARVPKGQFRLYARADRISAVSTMIANEVKTQYPAIADKVRTILNPVDTDAFNPQNQTDNTPATGAPATVAYTGRIHPEKGLEILIDAAKILTQRGRPLRLNLIGPAAVHEGGGGDAYQAKLHERAAGVDILFPGRIADRHELAAAIQAADVYTYPSRAERGEACPVAPLEAMAAGRAPIVSALKQFDDYIRHDINGEIFDHNSPTAAQTLADLIERRLNDPQRDHALGVQARAMALNHSYAKITANYLEDWQGLLHDRA